MEKRTYELIVLLHPDLEIDLETPIKKIERIITNAGGSIVKRDNWGKKRLAYRIKKQDFAVYLYFEVELEPENVRQVESALLIADEVHRHLLVQHDPAADKQPKVAAKAETEPAEKEES